MSDIDPCNSCGHTPVASILAVSDVLVVRALETVGKRIVRADRNRFNTLGDRPWHEAHLIWRPDEAMVDKAMKGAWDVLPAMLQNHDGSGVITAMQLQDVIDSYVRLLLFNQTPHHLNSLRVRIESSLYAPSH